MYSNIAVYFSNTFGNPRLGEDVLCSLSKSLSAKNEYFFQKENAKNIHVSLYTCIIVCIIVYWCLWSTYQIVSKSDGYNVHKSSLFESIIRSVICLSGGMQKTSILSKTIYFILSKSERFIN